MTDDRHDPALVRQARLANMRQEMLAPVGAIVGYAELVVEAASRTGLDEFAPDLEKVLGSARDLYAAIDRLLDRDSAAELFEGRNETEVQHTLRHDLRTPINAIKGYGELILEELEDMDGDALKADLESLLGETDHLLAQLDGIIDFSRDETDVAGDRESAAATRMFADIARSIQPAGTPEDRETGRILVVDDIATNRDLLSRRLSQDGHDVETAAGGAEALRRLKEQAYDLVLLDLMMPDVNGFDVLRQIKSSPELRDTPVIMISALDEIDSVIRCIEVGAEDYLPKPFKPVLLRARINASLERKRWRDRERHYLRQIEEEKEKHESLLLNILPRPIVSRLDDGESLIADRFDNVTVLFSDIVGFTEMSSNLTPARVVTLLNELFSEFDGIARDHGVEKIKMIGDGYMVASGVPEPRDDHAEAMARMALDMLDAASGLAGRVEENLAVRIGLHSGPVVGGVIGTHRFLYDVWGDTVNVASRLEAASLPNRIHVSAASAERLAGSFGLEPRGSIDVKGKGQLETYFLSRSPSSV